MTRLERIVKELLGNLSFQLATLQAVNEQQAETIKSLEAQLKASTKES